jgi:predicted transcriptional regulator
LGEKRVTFKLMPETIERVKRCAEVAAISQSEYVEAAVREKFEADGVFKR